MRLNEGEVDWFDLTTDYKNTVVVKLRWDATLNREELEQLLELVKQREAAAKIPSKPGTKFRNGGVPYITVSRSTGMAALGVTDSIVVPPTALFAVNTNDGTITWWAHPEISHQFVNGWD